MILNELCEMCCYVTTNSEIVLGGLCIYKTDALFPCAVKRHTRASRDNPITTKQIEQELTPMMRTSLLLPGTGRSQLERRKYPWSCNELTPHAIGALVIPARFKFQSWKHAASEKLVFSHKTNLYVINKACYTTTEKKAAALYSLIPSKALISVVLPWLATKILKTSKIGFFTL